MGQDCAGKVHPVGHEEEDDGAGERRCSGGEVLCMCTKQWNFLGQNNMCIA